jgi:hypothetical protein
MLVQNHCLIRLVCQPVNNHENPGCVNYVSTMWQEVYSHHVGNRETHIPVEGGAPL